MDFFSLKVSQSFSVNIIPSIDLKQDSHFYLMKLVNIATDSIIINDGMWLPLVLDNRVRLKLFSESTEESWFLWEEIQSCARGIIFVSLHGHKHSRGSILSYFAWKLLPPGCSNQITYVNIKCLENCTEWNIFHYRELNILLNYFFP